MFEETYSKVQKMFRVGVCLALAALVIWRGQAFVDPNGQLVAPVMTVVTGMFLLLTAVVFVTRSSEAEGE